MAGDWIKMRTDLWTDPRVVRLVGELPKSSRATIVGGLYRLWSLADTHSEDGNLAGYDLDILDREIGVRGFAEALVRIGWLSMIDGGVAIPRFLEHNGHSTKERAQSAVRQQEWRFRNAHVTDSSRSRNARGVTREEKRRETPLTPLPASLPPVQGVGRPVGGNRKRTACPDCGKPSGFSDGGQCEACILAERKRVGWVAP